MPNRRSPHILIKTKLNRPPVGANWVHRPRLISRLDEGLTERARIISEPPGFGKNILAVRRPDQTSKPSVWRRRPMTPAFRIALNTWMITDIKVTSRKGTKAI
jgi:hypothetical protein